jgi:O-methyltransferase domain
MHLHQKCVDSETNGSMQPPSPNSIFMLGADFFGSRVLLSAVMTGISLGNARAIAAAFPWTNCSNFLDVGCAQGGFSATLAHAHPHLKGIGFDLPAVGPIFERYALKHSVSNRLRFQPGDFFADALPTADVVVMGLRRQRGQDKLSKTVRAPSGGAPPLWRSSHKASPPGLPIGRGHRCHSWHARAR